LTIIAIKNSILNSITTIIHSTKKNSISIKVTHSTQTISKSNFNSNSKTKAIIIILSTKIITIFIITPSIIKSHNLKLNSHSVILPSKQPTLSQTHQQSPD
jgi:hypothetical protein